MQKTISKCSSFEVNRLNLHQVMVDLWSGIANEVIEITRNKRLADGPVEVFRLIVSSDESGKKHAPEKGDERPPVFKPGTREDGIETEEQGATRVDGP